MSRLFGQTDSGPPLDDPSALAKFGKLELVARLVVEGFIMGQHKSPFKGSSIEFVEHRNYYPGDEIRHIDWRAYGKTGKYYVKEYEDETNLRSYLLVDASGSMTYAGRTLSKFHYVKQLAAALGYLLLAQRDAVGLVTFDDKQREHIPPTSSPRNFQQIIRTLEQTQPGGETNLGEVFASLLTTIKRRSLIVILTDAFAPLDSLMTALKRYRHARHEVILFQVHAPEEEEFPFSSPTQFRSLERAGHRLLVDPHRLRKHYLEQYEQFQKELTRRCGQIGVDHQRFLTTEDYRRVLGAYLDARARL